MNLRRLVSMEDVLNAPYQIQPLVVAAPFRRFEDGGSGLPTCPSYEGLKREVSVGVDGIREAPCKLCSGLGVIPRNALLCIQADLMVLKGREPNV